MVTPTTIEAAARLHDWRECSRLMFLWLFRCRRTEQRDVAKDILDRHAGYSIARALAHGRRRRTLFAEFKVEPLEEPDAADAEHENARIEFENGLSSQISDAATKHFASAIRSAVTAHQVRAWIEQYPDSYRKWANGERFVGPTFLTASQASKIGEQEWRYVEKVLLARPSLRNLSASELLEFDQRRERIYAEWARTLS